jgi:dynactin-6
LTPGRASVKIATGAVVVSECELRGDISIGSRTVVHPRARIIADAGPIIIGEGNLIEERAEIINSWPNDTDVPVGGSETGRSQRVMIIGNNNVFEVGCRCEGVRIGDNNILESKARLGRQTELGNGCIIGAMCSVTCRESLADNTVIYGSKCERRIQIERPPPQTLQLDFLTKILPNYHHLKKPNVGGTGTRTPTK